MKKEKQKIFTIYHGRFPGELGIAFFVAKMSEAFSRKGAEVVVLVPRRLGRTRKKPSEYFGTEDNYKVVFLPVLDLFFLKKIEKVTFMISLVSFSVVCVFYLLFKGRKEDVIHSSDSLPLLFVSYFFPKTVYEVHNYPKAQKSFYRTLFNRLWKVLVTNRWKMGKLAKDFSIPQDKIHYESNAVDFKFFGSDLPLESARRELSLPKDNFVITYVGMLRTMGMEKGLSSLFEMIQKLPSKFTLLLVGGKEGDINFYKEMAKKDGIQNRVIFAGFVQNNDVPKYLRASNALVAPFPRNEHYDLYMSPMKIFEYMTSGRPIVTTPLNSILEVLGKNSAIFVEPGNVSGFVEAMEKIDKNPVLAEEMAQRARKEIEEHSWEKRAERILKFFN